MLRVILAETRWRRIPGIPTPRAAYVRARENMREHSERACSRSPAWLRLTRYAPPRPARRGLTCQRPLARGPIAMHRAVAHRLVDDDVAVANLDVVQAVGVRAYPRLELNRRALAAKIGQRHEIPSATLPTSRKLEFHSHLPFLQLCAAAPGFICPPTPPLGAGSPLAELPPQCPLLRKARLMPIQQYNTRQRPAAVRAQSGASPRRGRKFRAMFSASRAPYRIINSPRRALAVVSSVK